MKRRRWHITITTGQIETALYERFHRVYKAFGDFVDSGPLWEDCLVAVRNVGLLRHIVFCNDVHQIPPAHTFLRAGTAITRDMTELEKRSVGAFWGFVFKFVFGYRNQKSVAARVNTVKTATYFFDIAEEVIILSECEACVGAFFWKDDKVLAEPVLLSKSEKYGGKLTAALSHADLYDKHFRHGEYYDTPRGRVVFDLATCHAIVYIDRCLDNAAMLASIAEAFGLDEYSKEYDEHYQCKNCIGGINI